MPSPILSNETKRVDALRSYRLLDTAPEQTFDDFTQLASYICGTPISLITLVDTSRQWFKSKVGLEADETPREQAFCAHTILTEHLMLVEDASRDARFAANPLVTSEPHIRFYAGAPLIDSEGFALGSLCVIDRKSRTLSAEQQNALMVIARQIVAQFELRRASASLAAALTDLNILRGLIPICGHCKKIRDDQQVWQGLETYISAHSEARFSHGVCPCCMEKHYGELLDKGPKPRPALRQRQAES